MSSPILFPRHLRATIPDGVAQEIQRRITAGVLREGDQLPSVEQLATDFGVSRTSIREALQALAARGVVEIKHGRGTFIRATIERVDSHTTWIKEQQYALQELCELRLAVETTAARLAAVKATPAEIEQIAAAIEAMRSAETPEQIITRDRQFHETIMRAAHNRLLEQAMDLDAEFLGQARLRMQADPAHAIQSVAEHGRVLAAIERHDPEGAALMMREHLRAVELGLGVHLP